MAVTKAKLSLSTVRNLDGGKVEEAVNAELMKIAQDIQDRPRDKSTRKVLIEIRVTPGGPDDAVTVEHGKLDFKIKSSIPDRQTQEYQIGLHPNGTIVVNPYAPEDPNQRTFDEAR